MSDANFYHEFERNFRGSREEIHGRLERGYADFLAVLVRHMPEPKALDLGCGRGEWLELAQSMGFVAHGVDLDAGMLADCIERGLSVTHGDAIAYLANEPDDSLAVVSGFHIAEHLPFEVLQKLISEAARALRPGGLLILETPNVENISVGTLSFHMDPTHNKPLPPGLLSFLARHHGFERAEVLRLQENALLREGGDVGLINVFTGVSPDYSVVAQKAGPDDITAEMAEVYARDRGLTLDTLAERFEGTLEQKSAARVDAARSELDARMEARIGELMEINRRQDQALGDLRGLVEQQHRRLDEQWAQIGAIYTSTSWRLTWPVRFAGKALKRARAVLVRIAKAMLRRLIKVPAVRQLSKWAEPRFPALANRARQALHGTAASAGVEAAGFRQELGDRLLSPRARLIYAQLADRAEDSQK